ncbi:hypothetical protein Z043_125522, partial [Scleropages formosus]
FAAFLLTSAVSGQSARAGAAVERHNSQDRLGERQRVLHWDLFHGGSEPSVERVLDMFPSGERRVYNSANKGRVNVSSTAFLDGNFSLVIRGVGMSDRGIYSCNLHHHYCHLNESLKVQLNVTKSERKVRRSWDGEKAVFVVLLNSTVTLPCINRRPLWVKRQRESRNQVVRWDWRPLGAPWGDAERLLDVLSSGEAPERGPLFQTRRMNVSDKPFSLGDFSLTIGDLQASDEGLYSCHMHHQYCGLRKIITYQLSVVSPDLHPSAPDHPNGNQTRAQQSDVCRLCSGSTGKGEGLIQALQIFLERKHRKLLGDGGVGGFGDRISPAETLLADAQEVTASVPLEQLLIFVLLSNGWVLHTGPVKSATPDKPEQPYRAALHPKLF